MTKDKIITIYTMVVVAYVLLPILDLRYTDLGEFVAQFVEPIVSPLSSSLGTNEQTAAILLVGGLLYLKKRIGY